MNLSMQSYIVLEQEVMIVQLLGYVGLFGASLVNAWLLIVLEVDFFISTPSCLKMNIAFCSHIRLLLFIWPIYSETCE
jgi:hypothetical protein